MLNAQRTYVLAAIATLTLPLVAQPHKVTQQEVDRITREAILIDTHNDITSRTVEGYDIAEKISTELRNQYVIGYTPKNISRDGKWRKVKVKVNPPPGLPPLTIYARTGYYAPLQ